jgi:hypothetical protein
MGSSHPKCNDRRFIPALFLLWPSVGVYVHLQEGTEMFLAVDLTFPTQLLLFLKKDLIFMLREYLD